MHKHFINNRHAINSNMELSLYRDKSKKKYCVDSTMKQTLCGIQSNKIRCCVLVYKTILIRKNYNCLARDKCGEYRCVSIVNAGVHLSGRQFAYLHVPYIYHLL